MALAVASHAKAGLVSPYGFGNFALSNAPTCGGDLVNGSALNAGNSIVLTGSNSGSGCASTTDLVTTAQASGTVQFQYSYSSLDAPGADFAGYLLQSNFTQLADTNGQSGNAMFSVAAGQTFGFRVATQDNTGEPGILTVTNFSAPVGASPVPEPASAGLAIAGALAFVLKRRSDRVSNRRDRIGGVAPNEAGL